MHGIATSTQTLSAVGPGAPIPIISPLRVGTYGPSFAGPVFQPGVLAFVSSGGSLTYNIEVTGDDVFAHGYNPATGNWQPFTGMSGLTASAVNTLGAAVTAIRANVTGYVSGSLVFQFVQLAG